MAAIIICTIAETHQVASAVSAVERGKEVVGRECTAAEKADFIQFVIRGGRS